MIELGFDSDGVLTVYYSHDYDHDTVYHMREQLLAQMMGWA